MKIESESDIFLQILSDIIILLENGVGGGPPPPQKPSWIVGR